MRRIATIAVIGGGIIGSWTALHLAEAGVSVTLFEQFPLPHTRGSSHGLSRAFRFLGELEMDRLDYSLDRWQALERMTGETVFAKTGLLNFGPPGDAELIQFMQVLRESGRPFEWMDRETIAARYPMLNYPEKWGAAWDPNAGILIAHRCLNAVQERFLQLGGRIITGRVESLITNKNADVALTVHERLAGQTQVKSFNKVVVCAGPWTARLIPLLADLLSCLLTPVTYWSDPSGLHSASRGCPIIFNARLTDVYGLPSCEYPGLVKILFHGGPVTDPDTRDQADFKEHVQKVGDYVRTHLPFLDSRKPAILESCMYTMTPDGYPIIDQIDHNLMVGCGFSGSGFKHSPATGHMLACLALDRQDLIPEGFRADRYRFDRF